MNPRDVKKDVFNIYIEKEKQEQLEREKQIINRLK